MSSKKQFHPKGGGTVEKQERKITSDVVKLPASEPIEDIEQENDKRQSSEQQLAPDEAVRNSFEKYGHISIKPVVRDDDANDIGLSLYDLNMFPNSIHTEASTTIMRNGKEVFKTGLDEYDPVLQNMQNKEKKKAIIKDIRYTVAYLEKMTNAIILDVEDDHFWESVQTFRPDNKAYWSKIELRLKSEDRRLNPTENIEDLVIFRVIEAGGFSIIAPSIEEARKHPNLYEFYLDKEYDTAKIEVSGIKLRNKALVEMEKLSREKTFFITKCLSKESYKIRRRTSDDTIVYTLNNIIMGIEGGKSASVTAFLEAVKEPIEVLRTRAMIKDAIYAGKIVPKSNGMYYDLFTQSMLGKSLREVETFLLNPMNEDVLIAVETYVEEFWNTNTY